jgi:hypothetical protein
MFEQWCAGLGIKVPYERRKYSFVCCKHFHSSCYFAHNKNRTNLKADAIPTLQLTQDEPEVPKEIPRIPEEMLPILGPSSSNVESTCTEMERGSSKKLCTTEISHRKRLKTSPTTPQFKNSTKMEAKHFRVKKRIIKELRLFQSSLKKKRKMYFGVELRGDVGSRQTRIMTGEGRVVIDGYTPFSIRREHYSDQGKTQISIIHNEITELRIKFESTKHKQMFLREISREWTSSPQGDE